MKATLWPSPLIAGTKLLPSEGGGALPAGWLASVVLVVQLVVLETFKQLLRTKMFSMPFEILRPRFDARDENAITSPALPGTHTASGKTFANPFAV